MDDRPSLGRRLRPHIEHHPLGPRVFFLGVRWHDWHLGVAVFAALGVGAAAGLVHATFTTAIAAAAGTWLIVKDWRDLTSRRRDTAAWRLGLHRHPLPLRTFRPADPLPLLAGIAVAAIATVDLVSALTPDVGWRARLLLHVEPVSGLRVFHALAVPGAIALFVSAYYLVRRRLRALWLAVALLVALGVFNLFKGLDFEEATADVVVAGILWLGRGSFYVEHEPLERRRALQRAALVALSGVVVSLGLVALGARSAGFGAVLRETGDLLIWQRGPLRFGDELARLDLAVGLIGSLSLAAIVYLVFRPLAAPRDLPDAGARQIAAQLVRAHGHDTLAYFKLRRDQQYLFTADRRAFLGYRIGSGVMLISGEPVGPADAVPDLLECVAEFAERRGLRIAATGVGEPLRASFEQLGLRAFYIGDEAIVDTATFSLEGRAIRKLRQSVSRLETAGFESGLHELALLDAAELAELEQVSAAWRDGQEERGFSMALDELRAGEHADTLILLARDRDGAIRGFLHFVPTFGREAVSLSSMRREQRTPNGLTEFMIVRAIEALRARGVAEVSLNFAVFARILHSPDGRRERVLRRLLGWGDSFFQIESLYRFNAKFFPRWEPRYLMYEGTLSLPRIALATLWAEGQLPKPRLRRSSRSE